MNKTITILIGNSDDKLMQVQWSSFVSKVKRLVERTGQIHFAGGSEFGLPWQNACFVVEVGDEVWRQELERSLVKIAAEYDQESVAIVVGETQFIKPPLYYCRCRTCKGSFESRFQYANCCKVCCINGLNKAQSKWRSGRADEWLYSNWTFTCFSEIAEEAVMFNRSDRPISTATYRHVATWPSANRRS